MENRREFPNIRKETGQTEDRAVSQNMELADKPGYSVNQEDEAVNTGTDGMGAEWNGAGDGMPDGRLLSRLEPARAHAGQTLERPVRSRPRTEGLLLPSDEAGGNGQGFLERPDSAPAGTLSWLEQTDRAFRRDSRRYDGGFCLY